MRDEDKQEKNKVVCEFNMAKFLPKDLQLYFNRIIVECVEIALVDFSYQDRHMLSRITKSRRLHFVPESAHVYRVFYIVVAGTSRRR